MGAGSSEPGSRGGLQDGAASDKLARFGLQPLAPIGSWQSYARGAPVLRQDEPVRSFHVVGAGRLHACFESADGDRLLLGLYGPGDVVGFASSLAKRRCRVSVVAAEPAKCLEVERGALLELLAGRPELIAELLPRLARNLVGCTNCLVETLHCRVETRLACLFLRLLDRQSAGQTREGWIPLRLSRQELAQLTGTTAESASRVMSRWRDQGILVTADDGFYVREPTRLQAIALR